MYQLCPRRALYAQAFLAPVDGLFKKTPIVKKKKNEIRSVIPEALAVAKNGVNAFHTIS